MGTLSCTSACVAVKRAGDHQRDELGKEEMEKEEGAQKVFYNGFLFSTTLKLMTSH